MKKLYPLRFTPILNKKVWGNETLIISDSEGQASVVENGYLAENDISDIIETYLGDFSGDSVFEYFNLQFPVTVKRLETTGETSVHIHPDDRTAMDRYYSFGKDETLIITSAEEGSELLVGLNQNLDATQFYNACNEGRLKSCMNVLHPKAGQFITVKAGTVHSIGKGITALEIAQNGDIDLRLYDWGRHASDGEDREILLEEALDQIDLAAMTPDIRSLNYQNRQIVAEEGKYKAEAILLDREKIVSPDEFKSFIIYLPVEGSCCLTYKGEAFRIEEGQAMLVPASLEDFSIAPESSKSLLLRVTIPEQDLEEDSYLNS